MSTALVIGAGPAGSVASLLLARGGMNVVLIEQHRFPRDKVCGECISALGVDVLARCGLMRQIRMAGAVSITHYALHAPDGRSIRARLPRAMLGWSRARLDELLLDAASAAGAEARQPARCESIGRCVRVRDLVTNRVHDLQSDHVLVADGRGALISPRPRATSDLGVKAHIRGIEARRDTVHLFGLRGCYAGLAPIEDGMWNLALSVPAVRFRTGASLKNVLQELVHENAALTGLLDDATYVSPILTCPLPRYALRQRAPVHVTAIGNAACAIEPIGGEGIGLALRSAEIAAAGILEGGASSEREYRRLWQSRRRACRLAARVVSHPTLCRSAVRLLDVASGLAAPVLAMMGKRAPEHAAGALAPSPGTPGEGWGEGMIGLT